MVKYTQLGMVDDQDAILVRGEAKCYISIKAESYILRMNSVKKAIL